VVERRGVGERHSSSHYQPEKTEEERREREAGGEKASQGDRNQSERR
jgi:hypothetical protein